MHFKILNIKDAVCHMNALTIKKPHQYINIME